MNPARGFTLIEIMVALAVVAFALAAGTSSLRAVARGSGQLEQTTLAHWTALNALNTYKLKPAPEQNDQASIVRMYGHEFTVSTQLQVVSEEQLKRLAVKVATTTDPSTIIYSMDAALR
jgi:general secretion pathway protein I